MRARRNLLTIPAAIVASAIWFGYHTESQGGVQIVFLSVGQGDCIVIKDGDFSVLIDAGPSTTSFDAGERLVAPKLRALGVDRVDLVLLSHPDVDHIGGLSGIARRFRIGKVLFPAHFANSQALKSEFVEAGIDQRTALACVDGQRVRLNRIDLWIGVPNWDPATSDNEGSMVVRAVAANGTAAVFTGDLSEEGELAMASRTDWRASILKAGHHGSRTSTSFAWLKRVQPKWVVFSCGRGNGFGHPSSDALQRVATVEAASLRTDLQGDIRFTLESDGWRLSR